MYLTHNEGKSVVAERFIRTLKIKMFGVLLAFNSWYPFIINVDK